MKTKENLKMKERSFLININPIRDKGVRIGSTDGSIDFTHSIIKIMVEHDGKVVKAPSLLRLEVVERNQVNRNVYELPVPVGVKQIKLTFTTLSDQDNLDLLDYMKVQDGFS